MSDKRLTSIEADVKLIKAALLGYEGNASEGLIALTRKNERDVAEIRTTMRNIWLAIAAIPIIGAAVAFFIPDVKVPTSSREYHG